MAKPASNLYSPHPSIRMVRDWIDALPAKTGRSLPQWMAFIKKEGPATEEARRRWLKEEHGLGTNAAGWLAERSVGKATGDEEPAAYLRNCPKVVDAMYSGKKAALRPLHDALVRLGLSTGEEAKVCPCGTIVPLFRNHVFAQIKPSTNSRIDLGLALGDTKAPARLIDTGGYAKRDRITHRIEITSMDDIDGDVKRWLKVAYDRDAEPRRGKKQAPDGDERT
ncbi:MAG TPA: DUF5655 domain-containing protein [Phycisphaerales bacterium]|nr:DUF5655 domain-containing protein [Phycisphaerales bacterium]